MKNRTIRLAIFLGLAAFSAQAQFVAENIATNVASNVTDNSEPLADNIAVLIEDSVQLNPFISLRSLETGVPLENGQFQDEQKTLWVIQEVLPQQSALPAQAGLTQFKVPTLPRCLYSIQDRIIVASCDAFDPGSLWQIIPTSLGGVQIKSLRTGKCLSAGDSYDDFRFAPCQEEERKPVSVKLQWILAPGAVNATLVPPLPPSGQ